MIKVMIPFFGQFEVTAREITRFIALLIDFLALFVIASATIRSIILYLRHSLLHVSEPIIARVRLDLGRNLVLALEFLIGADILRTAISPSWSSIGLLGSIILLRTLLDYFLEREIRDIAKQDAVEAEAEKQLKKSP